MGTIQRNSIKRIGSVATRTNTRGVIVRMGLTMLVLGFLVAIIASTASAHALLVRSTPGANDRLSKSPVIIDLWMSEPLDHSFSRAEVRDLSGQRIDTGRIEFNPGDDKQMSVQVRSAPPGIYIVSWRTLSTVDGHQWTGSFPYIVLNPDGSVPEGQATLDTARSELPSVSDSSARWLEFLTGALLFGGLAFFLIVGWPAASVLPLPVVAAIRSLMRRQTIVSTTITALAFVVASCLSLGLQAQSLGGLGTLPDLLMGSRPGHLWLLRFSMTIGVLLMVSLAWVSQARGRRRLIVSGFLALPMLASLLLSGYTWVPIIIGVAALLFLVYGIARAMKPQELLSTRLPFVIALAFAAIALSTISLTSHAAAIEAGTLWALLADGVHLLAIAVWVGGLLSILLLLRVAWNIEGFARTRFLASAIARFSPVAALSVVVIVASGLVSSLIEVPSLVSLVETTYGRILLIKVALVLVMLAVGGLNAFVVRPRLQRSAGVADTKKNHTNAPQAEQWRRRLLTTVALEAAVGLLVLGSTSVLSKTPPSRTTVNTTAAQPRVDEQGAFEQTVQATDLDVTLTITPNRTGVNQYTVRTNSSEPSEIQRVRLTFLTTDQRFGGSSGVAAPSGEGTWTLEGPYFTFGGPWQILVDFRRVGKDDVTAQYGLIVAGPLPPKAGPTPNAFQWPDMAISSNVVAGVYVAAAGFAILLWRRRYRRLGRLSVPSLVVSTVAVLGGVALTFGVFGSSQSIAGTGNPIEATQDSIARGEQLFGQNCAQCHGATGKGDGPLAQSLNPRPVDLTRHVPFHPDEQIFGWISNGLPGTAMPVFKNSLSEEERWHLLNYLRNMAVPQTQ